MLPALGLLALLCGDLAVRRRAAALAGGSVAFVGVALAWVTVAGMAPLGSRPWPIGSTNGGVWNVVFLFNGADRLSGSASAAGLRLDPPGPLRFFSTGGHDYAALVGSTLLAALVFGGARAGRGDRPARGEPPRARRRCRPRRLAGARSRAAEPHAALRAALPRGGQSGHRRDPRSRDRLACRALGAPAGGGARPRRRGRGRRGGRRGAGASVRLGDLRRPRLGRPRVPARDPPARRGFSLPAPPSRRWPFPRRRPSRSPARPDRTRASRIRCRRRW